MIKASHLKGSLNRAADLLSRPSHVIPTELTLSENTFETICLSWSLEPEIDLFATPANKRVPNFASSVPHSGTNQMNAFTLEWGVYEVLYAFPPPGLIPKVLYKWQKEKRGVLILIAPMLSTQSYYTQLKELALKMMPVPLEEQSLYVLKGKERVFIPGLQFHLTVLLL